jgi:K+-sensing histidine kinase KdpD
VSSSSAGSAISFVNEEGAGNLLIEVAHDLQNPISSIISACEYLAAYSRRPSRAQLEMIAGIKASAATLLELSGRISKLAGPKS